ncbi:MAG: hypothetical protein WBF71_14370 [Microthrixaceae bacterium]
MSPETAVGSRTAFSDTGGASTADIWERRARGSRSIAFAAALTGVDMFSLRNLLTISLAASDEAEEMLKQMEHIFRTLTTTISTESERCILSVRGPILWSETITARANALGNEDVFVCGTSSRSFDTVENRFLVAALESIAKAERVLRSPETVTSLPEEVCERARNAAMLAKKWRDGPRLADVAARRLTARDTARLRGSRRLARLASVVAFFDHQSDPLEAQAVIDMSDEWTRRYHDFVLGVATEVATHIRLPGRLTCFEGAVWAGPISFRHPSASGDAPAGLAIRGIPLLPPAGVVDGSPWQSDLPPGGIVVSSKRDIARLMQRLAEPATGSGRQRPL